MVISVATSAFAPKPLAISAASFIGSRARWQGRRSSADIASLLRRAKSRGLKVAARGQGHSIYGRSLSEDGVVIDMSGIDTIHHVQPRHVVVDAGATWKNVLDATLKQGLTPPVLTNYLGLSIGGTLAVSGIGGSSSRYGMQTDNVLELDVVTERN